MTRERLVQHMQKHIRHSNEAGHQLYGLKGLEVAADAILAEMAGDGIERMETKWAEEIRHLESEKTRGNLTREYGEASLDSARNFLKDIRALRRPVAAPARPAPSVEEVARAICTARGLEPDTMYQHLGDDYPIDRTDSRGVTYYSAWRKWSNAAAAVLALFAKERS